MAGRWPRLLVREELATALRGLGLRSGDDVMVHAGLSGLGYLPNGADDVIGALSDVVGEEGTLLAPAHTGQLTDPAGWSDPPVPPEWLARIRDEMAPFDPARTPVRNRGVVPEQLLRHPQVRRSDHPLNSVAALGARADAYTATHPLHAPEGAGSPYHRLCEKGGRALMLGCGLDRCTALHVAEYLADCPYLRTAGLRVLAADGKGGKAFVRLERYAEESSGFIKLEKPLRERGWLHEGAIGDYPMRLLDLGPAVDWLTGVLRDDPDHLRQP